MSRQGKGIALPQLINEGYLTGQSQSVLLSEGTGEAFPDVHRKVFISVEKEKKPCKSYALRLRRCEGGIEEIFLTVLV